MPPSAPSSQMTSSPRPESRSRNSTQDRIDRNREGASRYSANSAGSGSDGNSRSSINMLKPSTPTPEPVIPMTYYAPGYGPNGPVTPAVTPEGTVAPVTPATVAPVTGPAPVVVTPSTPSAVGGYSTTIPAQQNGINLLPASVKLSGDPIASQGGYQAVNSGLVGNMLDPYRKMF